MEFASLTVLLVIMSRCSGSFGLEGCMEQSTYGYEYKKIYPVENLNSEDFTDQKPPSLYLEFYVKAQSNAHVFLSETDSKATMAYEIVIGGGKNTFSQIRLYEEGNGVAKAWQQTENIVSPTEFRGFWISVSPSGLVLVGKKGETEPFLFWYNVFRHFRISYFAFSTWNNVKGEWYFNCKDKSRWNPEYMEGEANMTAMQRLKNDLLSMYNPTVIPQREGYPDETIQVHMEANYFHLDEKHGKLTLSGVATVKWTDWKLHWNPADYEGIKNMYVTPFQIWTPSIRVMSSLESEKTFLLTLGGSVSITSSGDVFWRVPFRSVTLCILGYRNWPFDVHNCSLVYGFWTEPLKLDIKQVGVSRIANSEWDIVKENGKDVVISYFEDFGGIVDIRFRRSEPTFEFLLLPPFMGAAVLALSSFWFHPCGSIKLFLNCGSILILVLLLMSVGNRTGAMLSSSPKIVLLYSWSVVVMCVPIVLFICLKYIPPYIALPRELSTLLNSSVIEVMFLLPENCESPLNYCHLREQEERTISAVRLITLIERFVFLIYFAAAIFPFLCFLTKFEVINF